MNIVVLLLVALLLSLGVVVGEASSIDLSNQSFWLLLAVAPGIVMLVALGIHYRGNPRINAKPSAPIEPLAEVEPDELELFKQNTIEQLNVISAVLRSSTAEQTSGQAASNATGRALRSLQDSDGRQDSAIVTERFDKPVDTREETGSAIGATHNLIVTGTPPNSPTRCGNWLSFLLTYLKKGRPSHVQPSILYWPATTQHQTGTTSLSLSTASRSR